MTLPVNQCLLDGPHVAHDWWYTSEGGGHMIDAKYAADSKNPKQHHCTGIEHQPGDEIDPEDIQAGDVIREEYGNENRQYLFPGSEVPVSAVEYVVDKFKTVSRDRATRHVLLKRNKVDIPGDGEWFLGWITAPGTILGREKIFSQWFNDDGKITGLGFQDRPIPVEKITEYIPATPVPTEVYEKAHTKRYVNPVLTEIVERTEEMGEYV